VANEKYLAGNQRTSDVRGRAGATAKVMRMTLQSAVPRSPRISDSSGGTAGVIIAAQF